MNNRKTGTEMEAAAVSYLEKNGMKILNRNYRCKQGEVDIVGIHRGYLTFVEVKYRTSDKCGLPEEAVHWGKQKKICKCAKIYLYRQKVSADMPVRFDVVAIEGKEIRWHQNAFDYIE